MNANPRSTKETHTARRTFVRRFRITGLEVRSADDVREAMRELTLESLAYVARGFAIVPSMAARG